MVDTRIILTTFTVCALAFMIGCEELHSNPTNQPVRPVQAEGPHFIEGW